MSATEQHTPGPWICRRGNIRDEIVAADDRIVCDWDHRGRSEQPNNADARLIAAAPELAQVVSRLAGFIADAADDGTLGAVVRDALVEDVEAALATVRGR